jgi:hypothetical protein
MTESIIHQTKKLPRAIAKEKDGIVLFWVEELQVAGLNARGLAGWLDCDASLIRRIIDTLEGGAIMRRIAVEIVTAGGVQGGAIVAESDIPKVLAKVVGSKASPTTREKASEILLGLATAGFKLMVMLELAPVQLAAQVSANLEEKEILKLRKEVLALEDKTLSLRHYVVTALPKADADRILGVKEIETTKIKEVPVNEHGQIIGHVPGDSFNKTELCHRYGILTRTGKPDYKQIGAYIDGPKLPGDAWEDRMVVSHNAQLKAEYLPRLDALLGKVDRQQYLGEQGKGI